MQNTGFEMSKTRLGFHKHHLTDIDRGLIHDMGFGMSDLGFMILDSGTNIRDVTLRIWSSAFGGRMSDS